MFRKVLPRQPPTLLDPQWRQPVWSLSQLLHFVPSIAMHPRPSFSSRICRRTFEQRASSLRAAFPITLRLGEGFKNITSSYSSTILCFGELLQRSLLFLFLVPRISYPFSQLEFPAISCLSTSTLSNSCLLQSPAYVGASTGPQPIPL